MRCAVISVTNMEGMLQEGAYVENVIEIEESQKETMEQALGSLLLDAEPLGLAIGDLFNGENWTRNVDGMQEILPIHKEE